VSEGRGHVTESPIFARTYDVQQWLLHVTEHFPRSQRFVVARRIQDAAFDLLDDLLAAGLQTGSRRGENLERADLALARLRYYIRLSHEMTWLGTGQYEHVSRMTDEVGRLLGAWLRRERDTQPQPI
jgi:glutathione S-transferase